MKLWHNSRKKYKERRPGQLLSQIRPQLGASPPRAEIFNKDLQRTNERHKHSQTWSSYPQEKLFSWKVGGFLLRKIVDTGATSLHQPPLAGLSFSCNCFIFPRQNIVLLLIGVLQGQGLRNKGRAGKLKEQNDKIKHSRDDEVWDLKRRGNYVINAFLMALNGLKSGCHQCYISFQWNLNPQVVYHNFISEFNLLRSTLSISLPIPLDNSPPENLSGVSVLSDIDREISHYKILKALHDISISVAPQCCCLLPSKLFPNDTTDTA